MAVAGKYYILSISALSDFFLYFSTLLFGLIKAHFKILARGLSAGPLKVDRVQRFASSLKFHTKGSQDTVTTRGRTRTVRQRPP